MAITRRNTLILLFTVVAAAGIVGGTGAFSSVNADRTVSVQTAGDSGANVQFVINTADHPSLSDTGGGDTIAFDFDNVNLDANTTYDDVVNVTVNDNEDYDIKATSSNPDLNVSFDGSKTVSTTAGNTVQADITISTIGDTTASNGTEEISDSITFEVTRTS